MNNILLMCVTWLNLFSSYCEEVSQMGSSLRSKIISPVFSFEICFKIYITHYSFADVKPQKVFYDFGTPGPFLGIHSTAQFFSGGGNAL